MSVFAAILAAGKGERFGGDKINLVLRGKPVWRYSYDRMLTHPMIQGVGIVCAEQHVESVRRQAPEAAFVIPGGTTRQESCRNALEAMPEETSLALLHDAARAFPSPDLIQRVIHAGLESGAAAPCVPVTDTIKDTSEGIKTLDRRFLQAMQTPQAVNRRRLLQAFESLSGVYTDEMAMLEAVGVQPTLVEGETTNFKLTTADDLARAAAYLGPPETRTGLGYDIHPLTNGRPLILGGVLFPGHPGLAGHSDADVLLHAITDSILGAAGLQDIGTHFPNTDLQWKNAPSTKFLSHAGKLVQDAGWRIMNIDATVIAESPKIMDREGEIRGNVAQALGLDAGRISVKATTNEQLGAIGRREGIAAYAVATIRETI